MITQTPYSPRVCPFLHGSDYIYKHSVFSHFSLGWGDIMDTREYFLKEVKIKLWYGLAFCKFYVVFYFYRSTCSTINNTEQFPDVLERAKIFTVVSPDIPPTKHVAVKAKVLSDSTADT